MTVASTPGSPAPFEVGRKVVRDGRRGELVVLEERPSGLWRVAPAADPDRDYWIASSHLHLRPAPRPRGRPAGRKRLIAQGDAPFWAAQLVAHGWLHATVYPRFVAAFEDRYAGLTGEAATGETPGVRYVPPRREWRLSAGVSFPLDLDVEGLPPELRVVERPGTDGKRPYRRICSVQLFWELIEAGARLGKRAHGKGSPID